MRRRDFIPGVMAAITIGHAQARDKAKVYHLALVHPSLPVGDMSEEGDNSAYRAFFRRLRQLGYVEGQNLAVERYSGEGRTERFTELARQVVRGNPDLIFAATTRLTRDLKATTSTIPIVANSADPIIGGIVSSLARPGGNVTGTSVDAGVEIGGKRLELLREMVPAASRVGYLASRRVWESADRAALREAARRINMRLIGPPLDPPLQAAEYRRVVEAMVRIGAEALIVGDQGENSTNRRLIVELAEKTRLPAVYPFPHYAHVGGLLAYGIDIDDSFRHAAEQVDQILKGTKPGDIPFYQPTKFELSINLRTANALGIPVPPTLLIAADEVIE